jgi:hypothetical protein
MNHEDEIIRAELRDIAKIVADECWLEAERRGVPVDPSDSVVQSRVAEIILSGAGARIRRLHDGRGNAA